MFSEQQSCDWQQIGAVIDRRRSTGQQIGRSELTGVTGDAKGPFRAQSLRGLQGRGGGYQQQNRQTLGLFQEHNTMGDGDTIRRERDRISKSYPIRQVFGPPRASSGDAGVVVEKIQTAFQNVKSFPLKKVIFQLWRPVKAGTRGTLLSCWGNPCSLSPFNNGLCKYRKCCVDYFYSIRHPWVEGDSPLILKGGPHGRAYMHHFPEVVLDLSSVHERTPLIDLALECGLTCSIIVPVIYHRSSPPRFWSCVGVIEVSMNLHTGLVEIFNELKRQLKKVDLSIYHIQGCLPCEAIPGNLTLATSEAAKGIEMVCRLNPVSIAQVWITYESENYHRTFDTPYMKRMLLAKLRGFFNPGGGLPSSIMDFYSDLNVLPWKKGEGLIGKALQTHEPHLCTNIYKLTENRGVLAVLSATTKCTSLVICLRSIHTEELDYAFEFFWLPTLDHSNLLERVLLTLKEYLPSFKFASGKQLGEEISFVDVENPEGEVEGEDDDDLVIFAVYKVDYRLIFLPSSATFENVMEKITKEFELNPTGTYKIEYQVLQGEWYSLTDDTALTSCISSYRTAENKDHIKFCVLEVEK